MKYAIIIPDGAADVPITELGGKTPLDAAETPNLDRLASAGRLGVAATTPEGMLTGSDICSMSLLGYDPALYHTGRAPIEAAGAGLRGSATDTVCRVNLVTVTDGVMIDHSAGNMGEEDAAELFQAIVAAWRMSGIDPTIELHPGVGYRASLIDRSHRQYGDASTHAPHDIPGLPVADHLPTGSPAAAFLSDLMSIAGPALRDHPINAKRRASGLREATGIWIWGEGTFPTLPSFESRHGLRGAMTTAVDLLSGLARVIGWDVLDVPGATGGHDNDYEAQGHASVSAIERSDVVCCHVESPDEAAHQGDWRTKVAAIEAIDRHCVGPIAARLADEPEWRLLVMPDHYTLCSTRKHDPTPPPYLIVGTGIAADRSTAFRESDAAHAHAPVRAGHEIVPGLLLAPADAR
ncbi:MAG: 2,3-bisphosphoglycerate-independent phosphoglycerate mutase [Planctomycetota bacterium]